MSIQSDIQSQFTNSLQMTLVNIEYTSDWLHRKILPILEKHQLNMLSFNILRILKGKQFESISYDEIYSVFMYKSQDMQHVLNQLLNYNLIESPKHNIYRITDKGFKIALEAIRDVDKNMLNVGSLTNEESILLSKLLDKLRS